MSKPRRLPSSYTMLDLWRPPRNAGDPLGCLATTYTFTPGLFDEQCLGRFLEIESEPNRESLAFLLERESRLGGVYAGVIVDHRQAGVEHSLRWDVLSVRIRGGKQHAKLSLLAWSRHIRIIVASANLTDPGYRSNYEVAAHVDVTPEQADKDALVEAVAFLRSLVSLVPGASERPPEVRRAQVFLSQVEQQVRTWMPTRRAVSIRQQLIFTLPGTAAGPASSSLNDAVRACRSRGESPHEAWVASPFFDPDEERSRVTASLCKLMARGRPRDLFLCVPAIRDNAAQRQRLAAPKALFTTPLAYNGKCVVKVLPDVDGDKNHRKWHAKMLRLIANRYSALMIGSSNFTCAGMGVDRYHNAEANLLTIVDYVTHGREIGYLEQVWPATEDVPDPQSAEWLGSRSDDEEEERESAPAAPAGFLSVTYRAGDEPQIVLRLDPAHLPVEWRVYACSREEHEVLSATTWQERGRLTAVELSWTLPQPPEKLIVRWDNLEALLPVNVEDSKYLPPPAQLEQMSADDMLWILAASDPSAAFRAWAKSQQSSDLFDSDLDSATPIDLDPLRRYDLQATFLHRIRRRARILAQLRESLQRPVWGRQWLEWRLRGLIGIEALADRFARMVIDTNDSADEGLLTLADFLIVLREVDYQGIDGALSKQEFDSVYREFLRGLANKLEQQIEPHRDHVSRDPMHFWKRVLERCRQ